jgi:L-aspartate oxidase
MRPNNDAQTCTCDVLVVGGGVAGAVAARRAAESGADVILACKGRLGSVGLRGAGASCSGTTEMGTPRLPGVSETTDPQDLERLVIQAGLGVADRKLVSVLVSELPLAAEWLKAAVC